MLQENTLFANRYQLIKLLGRGGFSEVWLAKDNWTRLQIAIKVYAPGQGMDQDGLQDFCGELASVYDLNHSNLLKPQHVDTWENMPYLIMAYCPAGSCVKRVGKMAEAELWKLIHDVAAGLAYLHEKDVVHQDIKPDNILMDEEGHFLITDFGISTRARSTLRKSVVGGTTSGGTTAYMGPERFSRQPAPTKASDIWSFGAMAFELLEGVVPFGEIGGGLQKGGAEIPFINAPVSDALKYTIFKMLSKETWDRPTAATLIEWANNPTSIEIDYDLLVTEEKTQSASKEQSTQDADGRKTQRFGNINSDTNIVDSEKFTLSVNPQSIDMPAKGGKSTVFVHTNGTWYIPHPKNQKWIQTLKLSNSSFQINIEPNRTGKTREYVLPVPAYDENNQSLHIDIPIKQRAKAVNWPWILVAIMMVVGIGLGLGFEIDHIRSQHYSFVHDFDIDLSNATIDNIGSFEDATNALKLIYDCENRFFFEWTYRNKVYYSKKAELENKLQSVYRELDRKYQAAPTGTNLERKLKLKRDKVYIIKQKLQQL